MGTRKAKVWYGDVPNRRCKDCGERVDWDERKRLGLVPRGGPVQRDGITPVYAPDGHHGETPEGRIEQAKLQTHAERFHRGGLVSTETRNGWKLEIWRYSTATAFSRNSLIRGRPYYGILSIIAPSGSLVCDKIEGCRTPDEVREKAFPINGGGE